MRTGIYLAAERRRSCRRQERMYSREHAGDNWILPSSWPFLADTFHLHGRLIANGSIKHARARARATVNVCIIIGTALLIATPDR